MSYEEQATSFIGPVTPQEARELSRLARAGDKDASEKLTLANAGLVFHPKQVRRYRKLAKWLPFQDATQEGWVAMAKAVKGFDPDSPSEFHNYAITCINNHLRSLFASFRSVRRDGSAKALGVDEQGRRWIEQYPDAVDASESIENREQVDVLLQNARPRDRDILSLRFGLETREPLTHKEVGEKLGVTCVRARQLEIRGLTEIREQLGRAS